MSYYDKQTFLSPKNTGLLIDGYKHRLLEQKAFEHLLLFGPTGKQKTSGYIIPNLFELLSQGCSIFVNDIKGAVYHKTSGYAHKLGYNVQALNLKDYTKSIHYNPNSFLESQTDIESLAESIAITNSTKATDPYWITNGTSIFAVLLTCLKNMNQPQYNNPPNILHLLSNINRDGSNLNDFVSKYAGSQETLDRWKGFIANNPKEFRSFITSATTTLSIFRNRDLARLTTKNTIDFKSLANNKTIFYIIVPSIEQMKYFAPFLSIFYNQLFQFLTKEIDPNRPPIYFLLDEAGHLTIPNLASIMTTLREYRVSLSLAIQDPSQLRKLYGYDDSNTITGGGTANKLYLPGCEIDDCKKIEQIFGKDNKPPYQPYMTATEIRNMKSDEIHGKGHGEILYCYNNKPPIVLKTKPYYKKRKYNKLSKLPPYEFKSDYDFEGEIEYVKVE